METNREGLPKFSRILRHARCGAGVTLLELMVAMAVFMVIGGAAMTLFRKHVPLMMAQQDQTALNVAMRNAAAQMQMDAVNAGIGFYTGINIPNLPMGLSFSNGQGTCYNSSSQTYGAGCFDTLNVMFIDQSAPPANLAKNGTTDPSTTSSIIFATPPTGYTADQYASLFHNGDRLLVVNSDASQMACATLTKDAQVSGTKVQLQHNPTADSQSGSASDPFGCNALQQSNKLGVTFDVNSWVLRISQNSIQYSVDVSEPNNPKLMRTQGFATGAPTSSVVADQVIGFRVGAYALGASGNNYYYDANQFNSNWTAIRAVRISLIGRTNPTGGAFAGYRNNFDSGPYKVEGISVVINPRNMSMN